MTEITLLEIRVKSDSGRTYSIYTLEITKSSYQFPGFLTVFALCMIDPLEIPAIAFLFSKRFFLVVIRVIILNNSSIPLCLRWEV